MRSAPKAAAVLAGVAATVFISTQTIQARDAAVSDWTGFYIGGFVGGGAVNNDIDLLGGFVEFDGIGGEGFVGGGFAGINYQVAPSFVLGVQGEVGKQDLETEFSVGGLDIDAGPNFNAAVSARAGWLANPNTLLYIIGGYSYADYEIEASLGGLSADVDEEFHGFHIGAGLEAKLTEAITARIEYRYTEYGEEDFGSGGLVDVEPSTHTGTLGVAYNFYTGGNALITPAADRHRPEPDVEPASWTGLYVGGFVGGGAVVNELDVLGGLVNFDGVGGEGAVVGGFVGANYQLGSNFVIGAQVELGVQDLETKIEVPVAAAELEAKPDFNLGVSARIGYLADVDTLIYLIGGYSYAEYETEISIGGANATFDENYDGFHVGGGIETRLTESLTARVEYRYTEYGDEDWGTGGLVDVEPSTHVGTVGLAWNFFGLM